MSRFKFPPFRPAPALWIWSLSFMLPPAVAVMASDKTEPAVVETAPDLVPGTPAPAPNLGAREARRVLIDRFGADSLTGWNDDMLTGASNEPADARETDCGDSEGLEVDAIEVETTEPEPTDSAPKPAASTPRQLSPELTILRDKVRRVLQMYYPRHQNTRDNNPWQVMHAIIAYGVDTQLFKDRPGGEKVNAISWMAYNRPCAGEQMLIINNGKIDARRGVGVQGHAGQFLAILAQSHVKSDYPLYCSGRQFTLADLIEHEKQTCVAGEELTFKLISLMHYLDSDAEWTTPDGQQWSIQRLVREEIKQPIRGAACGGTHRLMGLSYSVNKRIKRGQPIVGQFQRAQTFVQDYHRYTFSLQNRDGSFSTEWFTRRGDNPDIDRRLKTSGHILEWIAFSLSDNELSDPRMIAAVDYVATLLLTNSSHTWEIGPLGHGLHALSIYHSRVLDDIRATPAPEVADDLNGSALEARRTPESTR